MRHVDTVFAQLLKLVPRHEFNKLAESHHCGGGPRWAQFVAMGLGHVAQRSSLRDVVATLQEKWLHKFRQCDEWNLCLTAGTVVPANQERR